MFLLTFDGAIRKWLVPEAEEVVFVAKDLLLLGLLALVVVQKSLQSPALPQLTKISILLYAGWSALEVWNPNLPNVLVGVWGLKSHVLYAGLLFLMPLAFESATSLLMKFERLFVFVAVPVCAVAFFQIVAGDDSALNQYVRGGTESLAYFGEEGLVRVSGTFSYISGMAAFLQFTLLLGMGLYLIGARSIPFLVGLATVAAALPLTGSRVVIFSAAGGVLVLLVAAWYARLLRFNKLVRLFALLGALVAISLYTQDAAWEAFQQRFEANRDEGAPRVITAFTNAFAHMDTAGMFGFGSGAANLGAVALAGSLQPFSWLPTTFEEESGRVVLELGMVGWTLSIVFRTMLLALSVSMLSSRHPVAVRSAAVIAVPFTAFGLYAGNGVFAASYMAVGYWVIVSLLALAYRDSERARQLAPGRQQAGGRMQSTTFGR